MTENSSNVPTTTEENTNALTLADELLNPTPVKLNPREMINELADSREHAVAVANLLKSITPEAGGTEDEPWKPERLIINTGKGTKAPDGTKVGDLYNEATNKVVEKPFTMFPLAAYVEYTKWGTGTDMGKTMAKSLDGNLFKNFDTGEFCTKDELDIEPGRFISPKVSGYDYSVVMYVTDKNFKGVYQVILKSYALKTCYDYLTKVTKLDGKFDPNAMKKWMLLTVGEQSHDFGKSPIFSAQVSDEDMNANDIRAIAFFKQCVKEYRDAMHAAWEKSANDWKEKSANMQEVLQSSSVSGAASNTTVDNTFAGLAGPSI
jgi:hypothetical protein